jgi:hypothetical protein
MNIITFYFKDGTEHIDSEFSWSSNSFEKKIDSRTLLVSNEKIKSIKLESEGEVYFIDCNDNDVFFFVSSKTDFFPDGTEKTYDIGKTVGLLEDDRIVEEYFIDEQTNEIRGFKK